LKEEKPDIACLQELRAPQERFPEAEIAKQGYQAVWHGQKSWNGVAILARGVTPTETRRGLPGDPDDTHSRYIEARVNDIRVGCIYLPNGNPAPGPKFDYKLAWFKRLNSYAKTLLKTGEPVVLCGDYNAVPSDLDAYKPERWVGDAVFFPETKARRWHCGSEQQASIAGSAPGRRPAITRRRGLNSPIKGAKPLPPMQRKGRTDGAVRNCSPIALRRAWRTNPVGQRLRIPDLQMPKIAAAKITDFETSFDAVPVRSSDGDVIWADVRIELFFPA
jgi:hypothetical protein